MTDKDPEIPFADIRGSVWTVTRVHWLGSHQRMPLSWPTDLPSTGAIDDPISAVLWFLIVAWRTAPVVFGAVEYLIRLAARPFRLWLQRSAQAAGWGFEVTRWALKGAKAPPVTARVRTPTLAQARRLRRQLLAVKAAVHTLQHPDAAEALRAAEATVQNL